MSLGKRRHEDYYPEREWWNLGVLSNYCGPGGGGDPQHPTDNLCREHDADYRDIDQAGGHSYLTYSEADDRLVKRLRLRRPDIDDFQELTINAGADTYFSGKRKIAPFSNIDPPKQIKQRRIVVPKPQQRPPPLALLESVPMPVLRRERPDESMEVEEIDDDSNDSMDGVDARAAPGARLVSTNNGLTPSGSKETPITPARPTYGLQDTHTTVIPLTVYFSLYSGTNPQKPLHFMFSLVDIYNPITSSITHIDPISTSNYSAIADRKIRYYEPLPTAYMANDGLYPYVSTGSNFAGWLSWWAKQYRSYTVVGCQWDLLMRNPGLRGRDDVLLAFAKEAYTTTDTSGKFPTHSDITLNDIRHWENINYKVIEGAYDGCPASYDGNSGVPLPAPGATVEHIGGQHRPYQTHGLVQNDQDTKRWFKVDVSPS